MINKNISITVITVVLALVMIFIFKVSPIFTVAILLCPLMHIFMMTGNNHKH